MKIRLSLSLVLATSSCFMACSCITGSDSHDDQLAKPQEVETSAPADPAAPASASSTTTSTTTSNTAEIKPPRVMPEWQTMMQEQLKEKPIGWDSYGLFSYGGWANTGQFLVYFDPTRTVGELQMVEPSSKKINKERKLTEKELRRIVAQLNAARDLNEFIPTGPVFDALEYELVQAHRENNGSVSVTRRVYMQNPGGTGKTGSAPHLAVIQAFEELRTQQK